MFNSKALLAALLLFAAPAWAQVPLTGAGKAGALVTYQGLGDLSLGTFIFYRSCSRAFTASYAAGAGALCEVTRTSDNATCTIKAAVSGFADLTTAYCSGNTQTIVQFCNATTCGVDKRTNQANPGTFDDVQATAANRPSLTFSGIGSLPAMTFAAASSQVLATAGTVTQAAGFTFGSVFKRTSAVAGGYLSFPSTTEARGSTSADTAVMFCGSVNIPITSALDSSWNGLSIVCPVSVGNGIYTLNGTSTTGVSSGNSAINSIAQVGKSNATTFISGLIAEDYLISSALNTTQLGTLYTNQHGTNGYNGAF